MSKNILVIGATGLIGNYILKAIVSAKSNFDRIAILTSTSTVTNKATEIQSLKDQGVEIITGDVTSEQDVKKAYEGIDTVISAVGRNVIAGQIEFIKWADSTPNVKRFFPSEYGTDIEYSTTTSPTEKPHQQKLKVRAFIRAEVKNLDITYLVTGPYSELCLDPPGPAWADAGGFDVKAKKAILLGDGKGPVSFTSMPDVGTLLVAALLHPEAAKNKALRVNSFTATPDEILAEFEKQTGGQKWDVSYTSMEDLKKSEEKAWADGSPIATVYTLRRIWAEGGTLYEKRDNALIGEPKVATLEDQVKLAVEKQMQS